MTALTVTAAEAAAMLGVCEKTVRRAVYKGELQRVRGVGRRLLLSREMVLRAVADGLRATRGAR